MNKINAILRKIIFEDFGGTNQPDHEAATDNLRNDEDKNKKYLGTYFPRSFVESFRIHEQIFKKENVKKHYVAKEEINILIIGSGTGGDLLGLLQSLNEVVENKKIVIYSFDGNGLSLCKCQYKNVGFVENKHVRKMTCLFSIFLVFFC